MTLLIVHDLPMPPSLNKLYFTMRGRRVLSAEGKRVKALIQSKITQAAAHLPELSTEQPVTLTVHLYFKRLENAGWSKGKAKTRYKRVDVDNRAKLLKDAVEAGLGLGDHLVFKLVIEKKQSTTGEEHVSLQIDRYNNEQDRETSDVLNDGATQTKEDTD